MRYRYVVLAMLLAGPANAMIQCIYYDQMIAEAAKVVQIAAPKVGATDANGYCAVSGQISRVFVGAAQVDDWLETSVPCDNVQGIAGPVIWTAGAALAAAKVIELHLDGADQIAGYGAGVVLLDVLTDSPMWKPLCGE